MEAGKPLQPFHQEDWLQPIQLQASAELHNSQLRLRFELWDPSGSLVLPASKSAPQRCDGLWQSTCFEAFFAKGGDPGYWELNLAPSGDWNAYRLDGYRQGLRPEATIQQLPHRIERSGQGLVLDLELSLAQLIDQASELELSLAAVLDQQRHGCSYWACNHRACEPDFHQRSSFEAIPKRK